jgi:hypothetical protein
MGGLVLRPFGPVPLGRFSMSKNRLQSKAKQTTATISKPIAGIKNPSYKGKRQKLQKSKEKFIYI